VNNSEIMVLRMMRVMGFPLGLLYSLKEGRKEGRDQLEKFKARLIPIQQSCVIGQPEAEGAKGHHSV
jgi:hypothetical protein